MIGPQRPHPCKDYYMRVRDPYAITRARILKHYSQKELSLLMKDRVNITQQGIHSIESGRSRAIKPDVALALADELDLDLEAVFADIPAVLLAEFSIGRRTSESA